MNALAHYRNRLTDFTSQPATPRTSPPLIHTLLPKRIGQFVNCLGMIYATYFIWAKHFG